MTNEELRAKYTELAKMVTDCFSLTDEEYEGLSKLADKPHETFEHLEHIKSIIDNKVEAFEGVSDAIDELMEAGKPTIPLKKKHCVCGTYRDQVNTCSNCKFCANMSVGETDNLVCNIGNQAKKAKVAMYLNQDIVEAFGVSDTGICRFYHKSNDDIQDITSYSQEDWDNEFSKQSTEESENESYTSDTTFAPSNPRRVYVVRVK